MCVLVKFFQVFWLDEVEKVVLKTYIATIGFSFFLFGFNHYFGLIDMYSKRKVFLPRTIFSEFGSCGYYRYL